MIGMIEFVKKERVVDTAQWGKSRFSANKWGNSKFKFSDFSLGEYMQKYLIFSDKGPVVLFRSVDKKKLS